MAGQSSSPRTWRSTLVPVTYEPSQIECPHCGTLIKLVESKQLECPHCGTVIKLARERR